MAGRRRRRRRRLGLDSKNHRLDEDASGGVHIGGELGGEAGERAGRDENGGGWFDLSCGRGLSATGRRRKRRRKGSGHGLHVAAFDEEGADGAVDGLGVPVGDLERWVGGWRRRR